MVVDISGPVARSGSAYDGYIGRPPPTRGTGMASVTTIRPPSTDISPIAATQGTLALSFGEPDVRPVRRTDHQHAAATRAELDAFAARFCSAVVEVLGGDRGPHQLFRWTTRAVYDELVRRCAALAATTSGDQRLRRLRAQVRSVHLFCPTPRAAELSAHIRHGGRSRAIAARLEHRDGRWICVALQLG